MISFIANLLNFMIIALVIYKSSKVSDHQNDETYLRKNMTLLAYLKNQYSNPQKETISMAS